MLILLQPGIQPLGQFDLEDDDVAGVVGGEVAVFVSGVDGTAAADVTRPGPQVRLELGSAASVLAIHALVDTSSPADGTLDAVSDLAGTPAGAVWGLVDEGSSAGLGGRGYGTMFGQVIGATVGQGTGVGALSSTGVVVVGPSTVRGSGKATLWTKPGLYGVTTDAFAATSFDASAFNQKLFGNGTTGKLQKTAAGGHVGYFLGASSDTSFVSTSSYYAGVSSDPAEFGVVYLVGCL